MIKKILILMLILVVTPASAMAGIHDEDAIKKQVKKVYDYLNMVTQYYRETSPEQIDYNKWKSPNDQFCSQEWREVIKKVNDIDRECECGGFFDFGEQGPLDAWQYNCYEGKVYPDNIKVTMKNNVSARVDFRIKDDDNKEGVPMRWMMCVENGEWKVANIIFVPNNNLDLLKAMREYLGKIDDGTSWIESKIVYTARQNTDGSLTFSGMDEGEELGFVLIPDRSKKDEYLITNEPSDDYVNPFYESCRAKYVAKEGMEVICLYDEKQRLRNVLSLFLGEIGETEVEQKWTRQLMGKYTSQYGEPLIIDADNHIRFSGIDLKYHHLDFNGYLLGIMEIEGGTRLEGLWKVDIRRDGLRLRKVVSKSEFGYYFRPTGEEEFFTWSRDDTPRFQYASEILLNDNFFLTLPKPLLRLMRNEIFFHHGYVPKSNDLIEYLADKQWYYRRSSNDDVYKDLSFTELLNIDLIKAVESLPEPILTENAVECHVRALYAYLNDIREYYLETPADQLDDVKRLTADQLYATEEWQELRQKVESIDAERDGDSFFEIDGKGPFDPWQYDCFEGELTVDGIEVKIKNDGTAQADFRIKDATTIGSIPMRWKLRIEDGEWKVADVIFVKNNNFDLLKTMKEYK